MLTIEEVAGHLARVFANDIAIVPTLYVETLAELTTTIEDLNSETEAQAFLTYCVLETDLPSIERFYDAYKGQMTLEEYAEDYLVTAYDIPDDLVPYIDYVKFARNLWYEGWTEEGGFIFRPV